MSKRVTRKGLLRLIRRLTRIFIILRCMTGWLKRLSDERMLLTWIDLISAYRLRCICRTLNLWLLIVVLRGLGEILVS